MAGQAKRQDHGQAAADEGAAMMGAERAEPGPCLADNTLGSKNRQQWCLNGQVMKIEHREKAAGGKGGQRRSQEAIANAAWGGKRHHG